MAEDSKPVDISEILGFDPETGERNTTGIKERSGALVPHQKYRTVDDLVRHRERKDWYWTLDGKDFVLASLENYGTKDSVIRDFRARHRLQKRFKDSSTILLSVGTDVSLISATTVIPVGEDYRFQQRTRPSTPLSKLISVADLEESELIHLANYMTDDKMPSFGEQGRLRVLSDTLDRTIIAAFGGALSQRIIYRPSRPQ